MKPVFIFAVFLCSVLVSTAALSQPNYSTLLNKAQNKGTIRVIVGLKTDLPAKNKMSAQQYTEAKYNSIHAAQEKLKSQFPVNHFDKLKSFTLIPYMAMEVDASTLEKLSQDPNITSIREDIAYPPMLAESIPFIHADYIQSIAGFDGTGWAIAILDSGVRKTHEFLDAGKVVSEACYSSTFAPDNATTLCPNNQESQIGTGAGVNCTLAGCSHGTHVAGIAAGKNGAVGNGVAPGADLIAIQVFSSFSEAAQCGTSPTPCILSYTSDQIFGLERVYALRNIYNIAAINVSIGGGQEFSHCDGHPAKAIIDLLRAANIATVISSGNDGFNGSIGAPSCISSAITVGATLNNSNVIWGDSNHASMIDLMAPGAAIDSSIATTDNAYASFWGTSMAAPHVAGAFALMRDKNSAWSVNEIESLLENTGTDVDRAGITKPRINLAAAIDDNYEPNDSLATAFDLSNNERTWLNDIDGQGTQANEDWYKIHADASSNNITASIIFTHSDGDIDLRLYDSAGTLIGGSTSTSDDELINLGVTANNDYYLRVYYDNASNSYDLWWDDVSAGTAAGDCTEEGNIDINDIVCTTNQVLSSPPIPSGGANCDGNAAISINDVICTVNKVLE